MRSVIPTRSPRVPKAWRSAALLGAAGLAASALYVQARRRRVERAHPPEGQFVEVDGVRLHYVERGKGQALVLLHGHGLMANEIDLGSLQDHACRPYRIIAFDRPGFGHSTRPGKTDWTPERQAQLFYKALHQMGVERPLLLGHGWGALITLAMALDYPKYVRAIGLVSGSYYPGPQPDRAWRVLQAIPGLASLLRHTIAPLAGRWLWPRLARRMFAPAAVPARVAQAPVWMALRPAQLGASADEAAMLAPAARRLSARYGQLLMPIAIIAGGEDPLVDADRQALRLHGAIQHSELVLDNDAGHMAHSTDPARVMAALERLETSLTPGGANLRHPATLLRSVTLH